MNMRDLHEDPPPSERKLLRFEGGPVDTTGMRASGPTRTTLSNTKLTRPAETYPGEAERMIAEFVRLAAQSLREVRTGGAGPQRVSALENAAHMVAEALRWAKP